MISRTMIGVLSAMFASAVAAPLHAAPAAAAAPAASVTYHIERHNQQVTVKDANEKVLAAFPTTTPTIQGICMWGAVGPAADTSAARSLTLTLKDQNGRRLWSTPVLVAYPQIISVNYNSTAGGTLLMINTTQDSTPNPDYPPASGLSVTIGADGRPMSFGDASHRYKYVYEPQGFSVVDPDGKVIEHINADTHKFEIAGTAGNSLHFNQDGTGTMRINGTNIAIDSVTKDGKVYQSFPWNGHKVLIEQGCNWNVTTDGDLTVNAPSIAKTTARK